ncbi:endonuclease [Flammeovirga kamogawensis]|uniref:endonuclease n=1 Tax=Flammeovirga kamogawensis TaxID=373891 RepID=UPI001849F176|nr:endonuclease [Flammeovirga kamogawensis]MBB6461741.1 endonuclease I [Flammeovirga kamogawensis]
MHRFIINKRILVFLLGAIFFSCVDTDYKTPQEVSPEPIAPGTATISIADLKAMHNGRDNDTTSIPDNTVIVGQVVSSDRDGNIYKEIYLQDSTAGILIRVDAAPLYTQFQMGQQVAIVCDDFVLGSYASMVQLGIPSLYNGTPAAGRIPAPIVGQYFVTGTLDSVVVAEVSVKELQENLDTYAGKRVKIANIQVSKSDEGKTYADAEKELTQNRYFNDGSTTQDIILRTSGYSDFAGDTLPYGMGTMYGVVSRFRDDAQIYINTPETDMVNFTVIDGGTPDDSTVVTPPTVVDFINESFNGTKYDEIVLEGWNNIIETGTKAWFYNEYQGNAYANLSVFKAGEARKVWLITPVLNVLGAENKTISFKSRSEYLKTATLKVMVSADYDGALAPSEYSWTEINPTIGTGNEDGYGPWTSSGDFDISSYGNVVVAFLYDGEEGVEDGGFSIDDFKFNEGHSGGEVDPTEYYNAVDGLTGYTLKTGLYQIISSNTTVLEYTPGVWEAYATTDDKYGQGQIIWDMYSDIPDPNNPSVPDAAQPNEYEYDYGQGGDQCTNTPGYEEGCYNREHSFPKSWFDDGYPMYTDIHHVVPSDSYVNTRRSNYPYGEVGNATWTSTNGSKLGSAVSGLGYSGTVFEPIDEYKGDFARIYFYMATRYENVIDGWDRNSSSADDVLNGTSNQVYETWYLNLMKKWHTNDPVSQKEIERNEAIFLIQGNRNPFIDHPEYVTEIWGN